MARFAWSVGSRTATLTLPRPLKFRNGSLGRVRTRYRSMALDQRTSVTELLTQTGADVVEGRLRFYTQPALLSAMIEDAANGALLTYEHSNGLTFSDLLLEDVGPLTEITPDADRYGYGEWERTLRLRHVGNGANLVASPEALNDTGAWTAVGGLTIIGTDTLAPDLSATADNIEDNTTSVASLTQSGIAYSSGDKIFVSVYVRKQTGGPTFRLSNTFSGTDPNTVARHLLNPASGATSFTATATELDRGVLDVGNFWFLWHVVQSSDDHSAVNIELIPAIGQPGSFVTDGNATGNQVIWGARIATLSTGWGAGNALPAYVPVSKRVLWQLFPPVEL